MDTLVRRRDPQELEVWLAIGGYLAGYSGHTRLAYQHDLRQFVAWCEAHELGLLEVRRAHIELFARWLEQQGMARTTGFAASLHRFGLLSVLR